MAQAFDADRRRLNGAALPLGVQAGVDPPWARGMFSVSDSGREFVSPRGDNAITVDMARPQRPRRRNVK